MYKNKTAGFSILEILVAVVILAVAIIPIFGISLSTTRSAFLVGRHMVASQIGQSLLEYFTGQPYKDAVAEASELKGSFFPVADDLIFRKIVEKGSAEHSEKTLHEFHNSFHSMDYAVDVEERETPGHGPGALFKITIRYRLAEDSSKLRSIILGGIRFPEDV